jgi:hypothetical protein
MASRNEVEAGAAGAGARRVTTLDHEALDHAVEDDAVVVRALAGLTRARVGVFLAALGELHEVANRLRGVVGEQLQPDGADVGVQRREQLLGHQFSLSLVTFRHHRIRRGFWRIRVCGPPVRGRMASSGPVRNVLPG